MPAGEQVTAGFALCDAPGYAPNCVVDGDTFRIASRRIRVQGIDAPERDGRCDAERELARRATADLLAWLERGPFLMLPADQAGHDRYGRELQTVWREAADGSRDDLGDHMRRIGSARRYDSRAKVDWC
nr:thermonuclease family protein [Alteraurantiacibacter aestuarii]